MDENLNIWKHQPYITHPLQVMEMMSTEEEKIVAVLNDVIEDTKTTIINKSKTSNRYYIQLKDKEYKLTEPIRTALFCLTKLPKESYLAYIQNIAENKLATKVKIADIVCNLTDTPSDHAKQKYLKALPILLKGL